MVATSYHPQIEEEFLARVADIAYQAVLRQGLTRPFLEVELDLWRQIRSAYGAGAPTDRPAPGEGR
jgi:hypothetical protein